MTRRLLKALLLSAAFALGASAALAQSSVNPGTQHTAFGVGTQSITKAISGKTNQQINLTQLTISGVVGAVFTLTEGTGTNCGTNPVVIYTTTLIAGTPIGDGDGAGVIAVIPSATDLCVTVATQSANWWLSWSQF